MAKIESARVWPNTNEVTKKGILTNDNFIKMTNLAKIIKVWQKCKQDDKRGMLIIVGFPKMTNLAKLANLAKDSFHVKVWKKI